MIVDLKQKILHATGLQTLCKLVESQYNNLPLGYHYSRSADNTPLLRILTPNMLRIGRPNQRSLDSPVKLPASRMEFLAKVEETYMAWYRIWLETLVPKLMFIPKWYKTDKELKQGDLVYFRKKESELDGKWVIGMVEEVEYGRDNIIRMVKVKYFNGHQETPEYTLRTVRKLVKVWDIEETSLSDDLAEMQKKFGPIPGVVNDQADRGSFSTCTTASRSTPTCAPASRSTPTWAPASRSTPSWSQAVAEPGTDGTQVDTQTEGPAGVAGDKPELPGKGVVQLADLMEQRRPDKQCKTCCCNAHHKVSSHYKGKKFLDIPYENHNSALKALAMDFNKDQASELSSDHITSIEDFLMSTNFNGNDCS